MRLLSTLTLFSLFSLQSRAQTFSYFTVGYNASNIASDKLDFVIDRYNATRPYLDNTMNYPHYMDGFSCHAAAGAGLLFFDLGFTGRSSKVSATGTDASGKDNQRDVKYKFNTVDLGLGINAVNDADFVLTAGINFDFGIEKAQTRADLSSKISSADYDDAIKEFKLGSDLFLQFIVAPGSNFCFTVKPYYHLRFKETDFAPLNEAINPATFPGDPAILADKPSGFGINVMIGTWLFDSD